MLVQVKSNAAKTVCAKCHKPFKVNQLAFVDYKNDTIPTMLIFRHEQKDCSKKKAVFQINGELYDPK